MIRKMLMLVLACAGLALPWARLGVAESRPNIVLILADDLGYETVECYGGESYSTPNLNRLAQEGIRFDRAYAMPLCTNTRIQLMTGVYNLRNWKSFGILDKQADTFAHALKREGYATCMAGKWQLTSYDPPDYPGADKRRNTGMLAADAGFDEYSLWHTGHTEDKGSRYADPVIDVNGVLMSDTKGKYGPDLWTDFIGEFMENHRDGPFFVYYSMALPHNPMNPTPDSPEWKDPAMRQQDVTRFAKDMTEYTDKMVGKVRQKVEDLGIAQETLILFVSDNGTNMRVRSKFRGREVGGEKGKSTELGCRVPMMAFWPSVIEPGQVANALIDSVDFFPTLLEVAGAEINTADSIDGVSFAPILRGEEAKTRDFVLIHQDPRPGWDKDRFWLDRVAIGYMHKLYEDGRLVNVQEDFFEQRPTWPQDDDVKQRSDRWKLERVLEQFSEFTSFDPAVVPRLDPNQLFKGYAFQTQDAGNLVVVEAEQIPFSRDESWRVERLAGGYTGSGYLRSIRDSKRSSKRDVKGANSILGAASVVLSVENEGPFRVAVRVRQDGFLAEDPHLYFKHVDAAEWRKGSIQDADAVGQWQWCDIGQFNLKERSNRFVLAPGTRNLKIDRIVFYRTAARAKAMNIRTPCSEFHPWSKP